MVMLQALTTTAFHVVILQHADCIAMDTSAQFTATLILSAFSTLISEMSVPSLPVSLGSSKLLLLLIVYYSHERRSNKTHVKMFLISGRFRGQNQIVKDSSWLRLVMHGHRTVRQCGSFFGVCTSVITRFFIPVLI